jgi:hypothetical protein
MQLRLPESPRGRWSPLANCSLQFLDLSAQLANVIVQLLEFASKEAE